ncbi:XdhC family protein [Pluralibacter gergoviae]|uniref:XdhC family protein n=1 Tax=Pluralibacter gergoviae TaxID=61647 RepID=UPI003EDF41B8
MQAMDLYVLEQARRWLAQGLPVWLCTVIHTYGSSPRSPGALLAATGKGDFVGSLSGGCIEEDFLRRVARGEFTAPSQIIRYGEGGEASPVRLPCGGAIDVLIEFLPATFTSAGYLETLQGAAGGENAWIKRVTLSQEATLQRCDSGAAMPVVQRSGDTLTIRLAAVSHLIVAGVSSVGLYCIEMAAMLGFDVTVCEHRAAEQRQFHQASLPGGRVTLVELFPARYLEEVGCHGQSAIVSLTHDPRIDDLTLMEAVNTPAFYIGAMGSKLNSQNRLQRLRQTGGLTDAQLSRIRAPIGLAIGSKTPAEIALAIMADIVQSRNTFRPER